MITSVYFRDLCTTGNDNDHDKSYLWFRRIRRIGDCRPHVGRRCAGNAGSSGRRECAIVCSANANLMSVGGEFASLLCHSCSLICNPCAEECESDSKELEYCKRCAEVCRECAEECFKMVEQLQP